MTPLSPSLLRLHWPLWGLFLIVASALVWPVQADLWTRLGWGWIAGVALYLLGAALKVGRGADAADIRRRAAALDEAGPAILPLALVAALASLAIVIREVGQPGAAGMHPAMALLAVALSWAFIHVVFAFHYAHRFYAAADGDDGAVRGGLIFPGDQPPDYADFLHFALIIGVASQTADIQISDPRLRRLSTVHSVTSFVFNTVILALMVNLAVGFLGH